jgi:hypothetical protein
MAGISIQKSDPIGANGVEVQLDSLFRLDQGRQAQHPQNRVPHIWLRALDVLAPDLGPGVARRVSNAAPLMKDECPLPLQLVMIDVELQRLSCSPGGVPLCQTRGSSIGGQKRPGFLPDLALVKIWQLLEIRGGLDMCRFEPSLVEEPSIVRHVLVAVPEESLQLAHLVFLQPAGVPPLRFLEEAVGLPEGPAEPEPGRNGAVCRLECALDRCGEFLCDSVYAHDTASQVSSICLDVITPGPQISRRDPDSPVSRPARPPAQLLPRGGSRRPP